MATYKVIQDIEAEDKLVGPLTLKQFIFAAIAACFAFAGFMAAAKTDIFLAIPFVPFVIIFGMLAAPFGRDQPSDVWLAAQIRFLLKPHTRVWDQSGIKELVTITAPKKIEKHYSNNLSQQEVKSRLKALADTIDSRGWAVKDVKVNMYSTPVLVSDDSDRLIDISSMPQFVPEISITESDDIMDSSNPVAQHFNDIVQKSTKNQRDTAIARMHSAMQNSQKQNIVENIDTIDDTKQQPGVAPITYSTIPIASDKSVFQANIVPPQPLRAKDSFLNADEPQVTAAEEQALLDKIKFEKQKARLTMPHHKIIETPEEIAKEQANQAQAVTPPKDPVIVERVKNLAKNSDDLTVASVAHLAKRISRNDDNSEIVINLR